jgi:uncharacterized membrane protein YqgA involved in biofilm formation
MIAPMSLVLLGLGSTTFLLQQVWITWFHWASLPSSVSYFLLKEMDLIDGLYMVATSWQLLKVKSCPMSIEQM